MIRNQEVLRNKWEKKCGIRCRIRGLGLKRSL